MAVDTRTPALLLLVAAVATGVYVFFQNAPEAMLYVLCVYLSLYMLCVSMGPCEEKILLDMQWRMVAFLPVSHSRAKDLLYNV